MRRAESEFNFILIVLLLMFAICSLITVIKSSCRAGSIACQAKPLLMSSQVIADAFHQLLAKPGREEIETLFEITFSDNHTPDPSAISSQSLVNRNIEDLLGSSGKEERKCFTSFWVSIQYMPHILHNGELTWKAYLSVFSNASSSAPYPCESVGRSLDRSFL